MDFPEYAEKYDEPYPDDHWGKWQRMTKQMADARYIAEESGCYVSAGGGVGRHDGAALASVGMLYFPTSWSESRIGLGGAAASAPGVLFGGGEAGLRVQTPTRLAPFAGLGGYLGVSAGDDRHNDLPGFDHEDSHAFGAVYPEVGLHFWLNGTKRVSFSAAHWFTTNGFDHDLWVFSLQFSGI